MAPPSPVDSKQPAPVPAPPAAEPAPAAKVEARVEASGGVKVPPVASAEDSKEPPRVIKRDWSEFVTAGVGVGYGGQNFQNEQGLDHSGFNLRLFAGPQFRFGDRGQHVLKVPFVFSYQNLSKDLGAGLESSAKVYSYLLAPTYAYEINDWIAPHVGVEFGLAHYSAPEGDGFNPATMTLDQKGAETNKNPMLLPMNDNGFNAGIKAGACIYHQIFCLDGRLYKNFGVDPQPADGFVDQPAGGYPAAGFSPLGAGFLGYVDVVRAVDVFFFGGGKKSSPPSQPVKEDKAAPVPPVVPVGGGGKATGAPAAPAGAAAVPAAAPAKKPPTVTELFAETAAAATTAKEAADTNKEHLKELKDKLGKPELVLLDAWHEVFDSIGQSKKATSAVSAAKSAVLSLELSAAGEGEEAKEAKAKLPEARKNLAKATADANKAYADAEAAYDLYERERKPGKKLAGAKAVKFDAEKPPAAPKAGGPAAKQPAAAAKPAAAPAKKPAATAKGKSDDGIDW